MLDDARDRRALLMSSWRTELADYWRKRAEWEAQKPTTRVVVLIQEFADMLTKQGFEGDIELRLPTAAWNALKHEAVHVMGCERGPAYLDTLKKPNAPPAPVVQVFTACGMVNVEENKKA